MGDSSSKAYKIPTGNMLSIIKKLGEAKQASQSNVSEKVDGLETSSGDPVFLSDLKFTVIDNKSTVFRDAVDLHALNSFMSDAVPLADLVAYQPAVITNFEVRFALQTTIQCAKSGLLDYEAGLKEKVTMLYKQSEFKSEIKKVNDSLYSIRSDIEAEIKTEMKSGWETLLKNSKYAVEINQVIGEIKKKSANKIPPINDEDKELIIKRLVDVAYMSKATSLIKPIVKKHIDIAAKEEKWEKLTAPEVSTTYMVVGGQASGKGTSIGIIDLSLRSVNIDPKNVVYCNTDMHKEYCLEDPLKLPIASREFYSQLTHLQAATQNTMVQKKVSGHRCIDQVFLGPDQISAGLENKGIVKAIVVSTKVEDAIERSYQRGEKSGRYENSFGILNVHKNMTLQVPDQLVKFNGKELYVDIVDNNVKQGSPPTLVANIDCLNKNITVSSVDHFIEYIKKMAINTLAKNKDDVYDNKLLKEMSEKNPEEVIKGYLKKALDNGYKLVLPEPEKTLTHTQERKFNQ